MGIGLNCRKILLTSLFSVAGLLSFGQDIYHTKACATDLTMSATGQQEGCVAGTWFFDKDVDSKVSSWVFPEISAVSKTGRSTEIFFPAPGNYNVTLTVTKGAGTTIFTQTQVVTVGSFPNQPRFNKKLSADTTICDGNTLKLDPYKGLSAPGGNVRYLWFPGGETTPTIDVDKSGCYSVEVFDETSGCSRTAKINVNFCLQEASSSGGSEKWHFGTNAVLEFAFEADPIERDPLSNDGDLFEDPGVENPSFSPMTSMETNPMDVTEGSAMVYGPDGSLVFYSDGKTVYAGSDDTVIGTIPGASASSSQGVSIIPKSSCNECPHHQYYLFSVDPVTKILSYSVLDMRYNDKKGAITETNVPVLYPVTDRITAYPNTDGTGFYILGHEAGTDKFNILFVDSTGVRLTPGNRIGAEQNTDPAQRGYIAIGANNTMAAQGLVEAGRNFLEVFTLADSTLSGYMKIDLGISAPPEVYGVTFSPNGDIVYVTLNGGAISYLLQVPLFLGDPAAIQAGINIISQTSSVEYGAIQLGPVSGEGSKYVYVTLNNENKVMYIQNPDVRGNAAVVGFNPSNEVLLAGTARLGLPNVAAANPVQDGQGLSATYSGNCFRLPTILHTDGACSPMTNKVYWEFEDGTVLEGTDVSYTFPKRGWNNITVRVEIFNPSPLKNVVNSQIINKLLETPCTEKVFTDRIYIRSSPDVFLPDSIYVCVVEGEKKNISPVVRDDFDPFEYEWLTAADALIHTKSSFDFDVPGVFKLNVTNKLGCSTEEKILVKEGCEPRMFLPDAMTPNGDGINDILKIEHKYISRDDFSLKIFNRWGELVFETEDIDKHWDGKVNGRVFAPMVYPYVISYKTEYFPERGVLTRKGAITVIR